MLTFISFKKGFNICLTINTLFINKNLLKAYFTDFTFITISINQKQILFNKIFFVKKSSLT